MQQLTYPQPISKDCYRWRKNTGILRVGKRMWDDYWQENWFWEAWRGRNIKSDEWKQIVAREKTKFKMKIIRGKKKVKWDKRREKQNMWIEINYNIKSSDLICTNLIDKKLMLKIYAGKKIAQIMEKTMVDFILVASSICRSCFFLVPPLLLPYGDPVWP